jgi:uncharacterized damage-inducible protein DinB/GNAT superfamily N-acetyltransferase
MHEVTVRPLAARDSIDALTALLHRAYAPLAARGMNFTAATQTRETTLRRVAEGQCFVAELGGVLVGTVTASGPYDEATAPWSAEAPWYRDPQTAHFHQFAVDPAHQRAGIGRRLVAACEAWARERRYGYIALDTAAPAAELRALYARLGYGEVGDVQWEGKTYRSVIMRKRLERCAIREHLQTMARYELWATRRLFEHVDALPEAEYRRDTGLFFRGVHGTLNHLLVGGRELWWRRFAHGDSPILALDAEIEPDRARLRERLLEAAAAWEPLVAAAPEEALGGVLAYRTSKGQPMTLPWAATLGHVFNHGTHHRGQITAAITALGHPCPEIDLVWMLQQERAR